MRKITYIPDELNSELEKLLKTPSIRVKFNLSKIAQDGIKKFIKENSEEVITLEL